jgi:hypothetical protein
MKYPKPNVGDLVYFVPNEFSNRKASPFEDMVSKVGRDYFYCADRKISLRTWLVDNGQFSSNYTVHPSKEEYETTKRRKAIWTKITNKDGSVLLSIHELEALLQMLNDKESEVSNG